MNKIPDLRELTGAGVVHFTTYPPKERHFAPFH